MNPDFEPREIEKAAQAAWRQGDVYRVREDPSRPKFYACSMLPYPSGVLHMGHVRNYTINDMLARHLRMTGMNVLMPMGWDAFGLPAENAAMKNGVPPEKWTRQNIAAMKAQMQALGLAIDWSREIATCDPSYYKWNQWMFLKMLEMGIAERRTQVVNWDPVDQTVLANEQVIDGRGWRSGALVEKREIPGYYLKITQYADELLECVQASLPGWPERVKTMQENWIGKSEGVRFAFPHKIRGADGALIGGGRLYVFTTRADTIMGVTFCAVAPEHPLALHAAASNPALAAFLEDCKAGGTTEAELATQQKKGMATGLVVEHPLSHEPIPLWVGNYVLIGYGDGAVMGVPAHDERDFEFAKHYGIDLLQVIHVDGEHFTYDHWQDWYADTSCSVTINSDVYSGLSYPAAVDAVATALGAPRPRRQADRLAAARLGHQPAALLGHADPDRPLRGHAGFPGLRRRAGAGEGPAGAAARRPDPRRLGQSAEQERGVPERRLSEVRPPRPARDGHDGHLRRQRLVLHALLRPDARRRRWSAAARSTGCRWTSTSAASSTRSCTCSTRASGPR